jgi:hypothetical protein
VRADPTTLDEALALIKDIDDDRQNLVDQLKNALAPDGPHRQKSRNRVTLAHGAVRYIGRDLFEELEWVLDNVPKKALVGHRGAIVSILNSWRHSPYTKFDDESIPPGPP